MSCKGCESKAQAASVAIGVRGDVIPVEGGFSFRLEIYFKGEPSLYFRPGSDVPWNTKDEALKALLVEKENAARIIAENFPAKEVQNRGCYK